MGRVEPHGVGSIMHVVKRGTRGIDIVVDTEDKILFSRSLFYLNDVYRNDNWKRDTTGLVLGKRPAAWPEREPLVHILAWTLMPNHFHLVLKEIQENGIAKFMQRLGNSMTKSFNEKYEEKGSLFQSSYKGKRIDSDNYLRRIIWYVMVKNVFELYPGGLKAAIKNFNGAWEWALKYPFSSLPAYALRQVSAITEDAEELVSNLLTSSTFKKEAKELLALHIRARDEAFESLILEDW